LPGGGRLIGVGADRHMRHLKARTAHLFRTEGVRGVLAGARRRLRGMRRALFTVERYVIFSVETDVRTLPSRRPDVDDLEVVVLESEDDMRGLFSRGTCTSSASSGGPNGRCPGPACLSAGIRTRGDRSG
jgi:hypothetical protein